MYDDRDRPPWLRGLRPARPDVRPEVEVESFASAPTVAEPIFEPSPTLTLEEEEVTTARGPMTRQQMLLLAILLWANVSILGCLCLLATGKVYL
jgi:hypothetical protein